MRLTERVYLVGSGANGFFISHRNDCSIYAVDCGGPLVLVDAGVGEEGTRMILANMVDDGLDPGNVTHLLITHKHADHSGGAANLRDRLDLSVVCTEHTAQALSKGDEELISLGPAKRANLYDRNYIYRACPVETIVGDGDVMVIGDVSFGVMDTPGHCAGHCAFTFSADDKLHLFGGDNVFRDGQILLQNIPDCDLQAHLSTVERLAALDTDVFLPGHTMPCLREGYHHLRAAKERLEQLLVPVSWK